jgi:nucleotide-binding universal stress UspA family protein
MTYKTEKILIAVDERVFVSAITDFVSEHKWASGSEFKVLHVLQPVSAMASLGGIPFSVPSTPLEEDESNGRQLVDNMVRHLDTVLKDFKVEGFTVRGDAKSEILKLARAWPADLMILGSHYRRGFERFLLGSVSSSILSEAPCSVVILESDRDLPAAPAA